MLGCTFKKEGQCVRQCVRQRETVCETERDAEIRESEREWREREIGNRVRKKE